MKRITNKGEVLTSETGELDIHRPVLDVDLPIELKPSKTPGHYHLIIDRTMPWRKYRKLLKVLAKCGIIEKSWMRASLRRGYSCVVIDPNRSCPKVLTHEVLDDNYH